MSFTWDWLLMNMITYGILDYYQMNACNSYTDFVLYRLGRARGVIFTEIHMIERTSLHCYRVMSFDFDKITYRSFKSPIEICKMLTELYMPKEFSKMKTPSERMEELRERRKDRAEEEVESDREGYLDGELYTTYDEWEECDEKQREARRKREEVMRKSFWTSRKKDVKNRRK